MVEQLALVIQIQQRLEADVAKPILGWRFGYFVQWAGQVAAQRLRASGFCTLIGLPLANPRI